MIRIRSYHDAMLERFGQKTVRIPMQSGCTCPHRASIGKGCSFCNAKGAAFFLWPECSLSEQYALGLQTVRRKWRGDVAKILYFQSFTNTFAPVGTLRAIYEEALALGADGLAIATRADCLPRDVLDLLEELASKTPLWVELGLQTVSDRILQEMARGYDHAAFDEGFRALRSRGIDVVLHVMTGWPDETDEEFDQTVRYVAQSGAWGVKFHAVFAEAGTPLGDIALAHPERFLEKEDYVKRIVRALCVLPPEMVICRLASGPDRDRLIAPRWCADPKRVMAEILHRLKVEDLFQGCRWTAQRKT